MRLVSVRYVVPVYATVDLDAAKEPNGWYPDSAVTRVFQGDESITMIDVASALIDGDVLDEAYEDEEHAVDSTTLSPEERAKAIDIAESTCWPAWERG
jgi:hypothetical protein